jgi:hypothetical protein
MRRHAEGAWPSFETRRMQHVEYLRLNRNERARATQLSSIAVQ